MTKRLRQVQAFKSFLEKYENGSPLERNDREEPLMGLPDVQPLVVFTGGSLIIGAAARTDLADRARTERLARAQT